MKCARLQLQERPRTKPDVQLVPVKEIKPRRYCQKRMVDPAHEEDPRWMDIFDRYHCKKSFDQGDAADNASTAIDNYDDICLTVQNLKFQGEVQDNKRPRTSFKYRLLTDSKRHRMFVKQVVEDIEDDEDLSSELTSYYFDDYVKYILNNDRSRPSSSKSSIYLHNFINEGKESKAVQVENKQINETKKVKKETNVIKGKEPTVNTTINSEDSIDDAKVSFHKSGKRKSLTISRAPSPETIQVIRVDVVCNYSTSSILSDYYDENKKFNNIDGKLDKMDDMKLKGPHFSNKYLLTNTVKSLDENVSGGAKVTLLCKTFKLSDRLKQLKLASDRKNTKMTKNGTKLRK